MRRLTIRNVPSDLAEANPLRRALGLNAARRSNGLGRLAGTWSEADLRTFKKATSFAEQLDEELWR